MSRSSCCVYMNDIIILKCLNLFFFLPLSAPPSYDSLFRGRATGPSAPPEPVQPEHVVLPAPAPALAPEGEVAYSRSPTAHVFTVEEGTSPLPLPVIDATTNTNHTSARHISRPIDCSRCKECSFQDSCQKFCKLHRYDRGTYRDDHSSLLSHLSTFSSLLTVIKGENLLSSFFSFTFKPKILQSFISSQSTTWFCHDSQKTSMPP